MIKSFEDVQAYGKDSFDAYVASATALTKGLQTIAAETAEFSRKSFEKGSQTTEKLLAAKSFDKAVELQQCFAKEVYENYLGQVSKLGEIYTSLAKETFKPFEAQMAQFAQFVPKAATK